MVHGRAGECTGWRRLAAFTSCRNRLSCACCVALAERRTIVLRHLLVPVSSLILLCAGMAWAVPARLLQVIPRDSLAVILFDKHAGSDGETAPTSAGRAAATALRHARAAGLLHNIDTGAGMVVDGLLILPELARYPRGVVLLDVRVAALNGDSFRFGGLSAGLVLLTGDDQLHVSRHIQSLLNVYVDTDTARLTQRETHGAIIHTLADRRLPDWAVIEWGALDDCYLIAVGTGAFECLASAVRDRSAGLDADRWFARAHRRCRGDRARWEWHIRLQAVCDSLGAVMGARPREVLDALGLADVSRGLWSVGPDCRSVDAACVLNAAGRDRYVPITITGHDVDALGRAIPPQADSAAVILARPAELIPRACEAYLATRRRRVRERLRAWWTALEAELGMNADADILGQLGTHVVIHDYPAHPLKLPLFRTVLVEIDGSADRLRATLDGVLTHLERRFRGPGEVPGMLGRAADGVWYVQVALYGPALAVTDHWVVISYSPHAVRANVRYLTSGIPGEQNPAQFDDAVVRD